MEPIFADVSVDAYKAAGATIPRCPGFGLPLDHHTKYGDDVFPRLSFRSNGEFNWSADTLLIREVCMLRVVEELTNKPEWWRKINDDAIAAKWKTEILQMDWKTLVDLWAVFTEAMADAVIEELRAKSYLYEETGLIPVMDYAACAIKSDRLMSDDLIQRLKAAVAPFENVAEEAKDWHPGSDGKVLDLVHPSMWPLVYGRSRVLPNTSIGVTDCLKYAGTGVTLPGVSEEEISMNHSNVRRGWHEDKIELSYRYQWLPCDVSLGDDGKATIASYINNVHPVRHADLYSVIEEFINLSLPAWDLVYRWPDEFEFKRMHWGEIYNWDCKAPEFCKGNCDPRRWPAGEGGVANPDEYSDADEDGFWGVQRDHPREQWFARNHTMILPEPDSDSYLNNFFPAEIMPSSKADLFGDASKLQVIVKLANIHLTPENPTYDGGSWHIEGQLNERIVATALFYYDSENITDSALAFRTCSNGEDLSSEDFYDEHDYAGIERALAIDASGSVLQYIGQVQTRPGRALFFPNLYQHRVRPFELVDQTKPGHRKILALFLVDPKVPVLSTANVPPQRRDWWEGEVRADGAAREATGSKRLPTELQDMIVDNLDFPISLEEAKKLRGDLMADRRLLEDDSGSKWYGTAFNFWDD